MYPHPIYPTSSTALLHGRTIPSSWIYPTQRPVAQRHPLRPRPSTTTLHWLWHHRGGCRIQCSTIHGARTPTPSSSYPHPYRIPHLTSPPPLTGWDFCCTIPQLLGGRTVAPEWRAAMGWIWEDGYAQHRGYPPVHGYAMDHPAQDRLRRRRMWNIAICNNTFLDPLPRPPSVGYAADARGTL